MSSPDKQTALALMRLIESDPRGFQGAKALPPPSAPGLMSALLGDIQVRYRVDVDFDGVEQLRFVKVLVVPNYPADF